MKKNENHGIIKVEGYYYSKKEELEIPLWASKNNFFNFKKINLKNDKDKVLNFPYKSGLKGNLIVIDTSYYLPYLKQIFFNKG
jgi:hypothetical protein